MDQGSAAIIAALAAGVFGIVGVLLGIVVGRRQTTDQATVEHGHWLRGQRLQAFTDLLATWDAAMQDLQQFQEGWNVRVESLQDEGLVLHPAEVLGRKRDEVWDVLRPTLERVNLLGPSTVTEAVNELWKVWRDVVRVLEEQASRAPLFVMQEQAWEHVMARALVARAELHVAVSRVVRTPPSPRGESLEPLL
jgi:hypothetical protein